MSELFFTQRFKVPVHGGSGRDLLSSLTEDAAQQESFSGHSFSLGVHLCTAGVAPRHCRDHREEIERKTEKLEKMEEEEEWKEESGEKGGKGEEVGGGVDKKMRNEKKKKMKKK